MDNDWNKTKMRAKNRREKKRNLGLRLFLAVGGILIFAALFLMYSLQQRDVQTVGTVVTEETEEEPPQQQEECGITVVVDAGHGGRDQGCSYDDILEKDINLVIARLLEKRLKKAGYSVVMTRSDDTYVALSRRVEVAEEAEADAFVSIHVDSYTDDTSINGVTVHCEKGADGGKTLCDALYSSLDDAVGVTVRNRMESDLYVLRNTTMPAVLIETGYITNSADRGNLQSMDFLNRLTEAICDGIDSFFPQIDDNSYS